MDRLDPRPGLRPIKVAAETPRYTWTAQPLYRAQIVLDAIEKRSQPKKKQPGS